MRLTQGSANHWERVSESAGHTRVYVCGHCGERIASSRFYTNAGIPMIYICLNCGMPTTLVGSYQSPRPMPGKQVAHMPDDIAGLWDESRRAVAAGANTGAALVLRVLLLRVALEKGITVTGSNRPTFQQCIAFLVDEGHVGSRERNWVDQIRVLGNAANHELGEVSEEETQQALAYMEHLLLGIYEFPGAVALAKG